MFQKYLVNACSERDGLSGDMLALSLGNLVLLTIIAIITSERQNNQVYVQPD